MKILLIYLQPKDIPEVLEPLKEIPCDKLYLKYYSYPGVYQEAFLFIKRHTEYTHIFWLQNDIILTKKDFANAKSRLLNNNLDLIGLGMNVDMSGGRYKCAYTIEPFEIHKFKKVEWALMNQYHGIKNVFHNGGPFLITRTLYLRFPLHGDTITGFNADMNFGLELWKENIPYPLDTNINLLHLRYIGEMQVGKKVPSMEYVRFD